MTGAIVMGVTPSLGSLVGSAGTDSLLQQINRDLGGSNFFGSVNDIISQGRSMFITNVVQPFKAIGNTFKNLVGLMDQDETFISIQSEEQLKSIPMCMHDSIMRYAPVKKLFDQGRIFGFGWDYVPEDDIYDRLIENGHVKNIQEAMDEEGYVEFKYHFVSTDPDLSFDDLENIRESREYIDHILNETDLDPTDYPNSRG
jgi:hypothetical protein